MRRHDLTKTKDNDKDKEKDKDKDNDKDKSIKETFQKAILETFVLRAI